MDNFSRGEQRFWENYAIWKETGQEYLITRDLLRVNWKSDKHRGMDYGLAKLTPTMRKSLCALLLDRGEKPQARTIKALQWRELVDKDGQLTDHGRILALVSISLKQQCQILNLPLREWSSDSIDHPEKAVQEILAQRGIQVYFVENTFGLFIDFLMLDALVTVAEQLGKRVYTVNLPYDPELFFLVKRDLNEYLDGLDNNHCQKNLAIYIPFWQPITMSQTPQQLFELFDKMYHALGIERVKSILRMYFSNPLAYNYRGWPDLFVVGKQDVYCVEVKTTDKLHLNQLVTIPDLVSCTHIPVEVVRLSRSKTTD